MAFDSNSTPESEIDNPIGEVPVDSASFIDELSGKMGFQEIDDGLMHSVLENDKETIDEGRLISDSINQGLGSFTPELMLQQLTKNYSNAKNLYGERLLSLISGFDADYIERNIRIPEFQRELKDKIEEGVQKLKAKKYVDRVGNIMLKGMELASLILYVEELKEIVGKPGIGHETSKKRAVYGDVDALRDYRKGDRYKDISVGDSVKRAIRRGHDELGVGDLKSSERLQRGKHEIVYALDASGSMRGKKLELAKKAGVALAYHAIAKRDKVGLLIFGTRVSDELAPTHDFADILRHISVVRPGQETNIAETIKRSIGLFAHGNHTRHLVLLSDAVPTVGSKPENLSYEAASMARSAKITISVVGIGLEGKGAEIAQKIAEIGEGYCYTASANDEIDQIVLEDYYRLH